MRESLVPILTTVIALIGTLVGIFVGYRKWKRDRESERFAGFEKDRQSAYKKLWENVEEVNVQVRIDEVSRSDFSRKVQALNAFMLKSGIYIDDEDRALVNEYLKAVYNFQKVVRESGSKEAQIPLEETQPIPPSVSKDLKTIEVAQNKAVILRDELIKKIRHVLTGK